MEVLSRKTYVETGKSIPRIYMTAKQLSEYEGMTPRDIGRYSGRYQHGSMMGGIPRHP